MRRKTETRPWGKFERFSLNEKSTVKILTIKPFQKISLQKHALRSEFWKFLDNPAKVTIGKRTFKAKKGDEVFIPRKTLHRVEAFGKPARILEISFGEFKENDIERVDDIYGRD